MLEHWKKIIIGRSKKEKAKDIGIGAGIGAAIGTLAGILFAPKPGKETREDIKNKTKEVSEDVKSTVEEKVD
ncbi:MAG: YtxH domain-containing protein, partial [Eubacteriales bacterium]